jgi:hypothetical protein
MPFEFINNAAIDRNARKVIRSHAAKGRNVGKTRPSRRKQPGQEVKSTTTAFNSRSVENAQESGTDETIAAIGRQIGDGLSVLSFPAELTPRSKALVQNCIPTLDCTVPKDIIVDRHVVCSFASGLLYPSELCNAIDCTGGNTMWIQYIFLDEACMIFLRFSLSLLRC